MSYEIQLRQVGVIMFCVYIQLLVIFAKLLQAVSCFRILGVPSLGTSHAKLLAKVGEELSNRGHTFILLVASWEAKQFKTKTHKGFSLQSYDTPFNSSDLESAMLREVEGRVNITQNVLLWKISCKCLLENTNLQSLGKIDLILSDIGGLCPPIFADMLKVPRVDISPVGFSDPFLSFVHNFPNPVAYIPQMYSKFPKKLSFSQRFQGLLLYTLGYVLLRFSVFPEYEELWQKYAAKKSSCADVQAVFKNCGLLIMPVDFALDYPRTLAPHVKITGPILPAPPVAIPKSFEDFIFQQHDTKTDSSNVILVSFGTVISKFNSDLITLIANALTGVAAKVIWKHKGSGPAQMGKNIKIVEWMPQNDLLGHPKVKAFVTHGGLNSIYESCYHGVPMVVIPLFGDQPGNAIKIQESGSGLMLDLKTLDSASLTHAINKVLNDKIFAENALRISKIIQSRNPTPTVEAANWVEYALQTNASLHLRSQADNLYFYELYLIDVFVFIFLLVLFTAAFFTKFCRVLFQRCCKKEKQKRE